MTRRRFGLATTLAAAVALLAVTAAPATADSFTPVQVTVAVAPVARLHSPLAITVAVTADPGVLDGSEGPLRMEVKLAPECGGTFQTTPGTTLVNAALAPQPATGKSYSGAVKGSGRPSAYGTQTVCAFLEDTDIGRVYANDESTQVTVSKACTTTAGAYDKARAALARAQKQLRHSRRAEVRRRLTRTISARRRTVSTDKRRATAACGPAAALPAAARAATAPQPAIRHVFIVVLENESASTTFGPASPAPYLSKTLTAQGAYLPHYYATGHNSNDNYISMISGQAPNPQNQSDCELFDNVVPGTIGSFGQAQGSGCVYPSAVKTIADQLGEAGFTWRDYNQGMGSDPTRETAVCAHPAIDSPDNTQSATASDMYATRHNPFVYFHSIIDDTTLCDTHVVGLDQLPQDLSSASRTANYTFITPDLCNDGHDAPCADGEPGGLAQADKFLQTWVPQITASPAFQQDGLLIVTFDEAATSDSSSCCGEMPGPGSPEPGANGPGGGDVGAVLLSPCITPGTVSQTPYNHYTMLGSVENLFGLTHLGYAGLPGETYFGSDIFNRTCPPPEIGPSAPPGPVVHAPALASATATSARIPLRFSGGTVYTVQVRSLTTRTGQWRTLVAATHDSHLTFKGVLGATYEFRVQAGSGPFTAATTVVPSGARVRHGRFTGRWRVVKRRGAWQQHAIQTTSPGAGLTLRYVGGALSVIGETTAHGGVLRVTLDGRSRTVDLHSSRLRRRRVIYAAAVKPGVHHVNLVDVRGLVALEGLAIASRTG